MKYVYYLIVLLLGVLLGAGGMFLFMRRTSAAPESSAKGSPESASMKESVERRLAEVSGDIRTRLSMFGQEVANDQLFSLRLLVENNPSAPEVTNKAVQFLKPMGFSLLDVTDSGYTILSCGQFPANVGNNVPAKGELLNEKPAMIPDKVMGKEVLTFQSKCSFRIAESISFYAMGGVAVDDTWLKRLSPCNGVTVLLKRGTAVMGMNGVRTISDVKDGKVIINDQEYQAVEIQCPWAGNGDAPVLIAVMKKEQKG